MACADYTEGQTDQLGYHFIAFGLGHFNAPQKKVERNAMTRFVVQRKNNYSEVEAERDREAPKLCHLGFSRGYLRGKYTTEQSRT